MKWDRHGLIARGPVYETNPIVQQDPVLEMVLAYHEEKAKLYQNFQIPADFSSDSYSLKGTLQYQTCSNKICLPPKKTTLTIPFQVDEGPVRAAYATMNRVIADLPA